MNRIIDLSAPKRTELKPKDPALGIQILVLMPFGILFGTILLMAICNGIF